jgi:hypothetical protein
LYGAKTMNMISTGAFLTEMDASDKQQNSLVNKLVSAWEKKNSKTARAGGVSLMALSLAACGSSDDTSDAVSYTQAQLDAATAAATAAAEATAATAATATAATAATAQATAVAAAEATAATAATAAAAAAATAQAAAVAAVDTSTDDAAAVTLSLRNAAAEAGATGTSTMTDAELIVAIKTANDAAIAAAVDLTTDNAAATNTSVAAVTAFDTLAELVTAYDAAIAPAATTAFSTSVDSLTGTSGDDTFTADNTGTDVSSTADTLNGGSGADTLNIFSDGAAGALPALTSVETVNFYDQDADFTLAATAQDGVTTVGIIRGDGDVTATLNLTNTTVNITDVVLAATGVILTGNAAATSMTLGLSGLTAGGATANEDVHLNGAAITTVTVNNTATSTMDALDLDAATAVTLNSSAAFTTTGSIETTGTSATLTITGAGAVDVSAIDTGFTTVAGSAMTGAFTGEIGTHDALVLTAGSGDDVITASTTDALATSDALSVDAGAGNDTLIVAAAADINTAADAARYSNFETLRLSDTLDFDVAPAGITALQLTGATSKSYTDMTATQAANIQVRGDETSGTFALKTATGTSDTLTLTMGTGLTTSAATDLTTGVTVTGFETLNIIENGGASASAGANQTAIVAALTTATTLNDINLTGRAVTITDLATTVAVDIDGSALTGNGNTGTNVQGLTVGGSAVAGSVITGSAFNDSLTAAAEGSTYNAGAGTDALSATVALIAADGATDLVLNGGAGTDTLTLTNTTGVTIADTHFTNISNMEGLTLTNTGAGDTSITTGAAFNASFADGATITSGVIAAAQDITISAGLATVGMTVSIASTSQTGAATETNSIVTGSGADTITYTDAGWVGAASTNASGTFAIDTNAGDDTISLTVGTLVHDQAANFITVTGGAGQDSMTKVGTNAVDTIGLTGMVTFEFAAGDSNTVNYDTITGFDLATATLLSDELDVEGTAVTASFTATADVGTIKSHSVTAGVVTFDDVADFSTAVTVSSTNLADVTGYLATNMTANHAAAFLFDSTGDGSNDGTMVFHQGSATSVADDLIFLAGTVAVDAVITTNSDGANDLFVI